MLFLFAAAWGAEVSRMPEPRNAEIGVRYAGSYDSGRLLEKGVEVADRQAQDHRLLLNLAYAPVAGVALTAGVETSPLWDYRSYNARTMMLEPVDGGGSYLASEPQRGEALVLVEGGGLVGVWVGAAVAPFHERYAKRHRVSWRLDLAVRTGSARNNRWVLRDDGTRGGGPGGTAVRISGGFSRRTGLSEPYVAFRYQHEGAVEVQGYDPTDPTAMLTVRPASSTELRGGCELHAEGQAIAVDVWLAARYTSPEVIPSGILLPNVLDAARSVGVTHSDRLVGAFGGGFNIGLAPFLRMQMGVGGRYTVPHTEEHLFAVGTSPDTFGVEVTGGLVASLGPKPTKGPSSPTL